LTARLLLLNLRGYLMMKTRVYLTAPYSARTKDGTPDEIVMHQRYLLANFIAGKLIDAGYIVFSPLSHSVPIADTMDNHLDAEIWIGQDIHFIDWCNELLVLKLPGYLESSGIKKEIAAAKVTGKPVRYIEWDAEENTIKFSEGG
jgi:hypothetical protein